MARNLNDSSFSNQVPSHWGCTEITKPQHWEDAIFSWCLGDSNLITSQTGQAELIAFMQRILLPKHQPVFIDIGANDGISHSSSYMLSVLGWKGLLIEPNPVLARNLFINRPNELIANCACTSKPELLELLTHESLSTLGTIPSLADPKAADRLRREASLTGVSCSSYLVAGVPASECYRYATSKLGPITFLKIDAEGCELLIISSLFSNLDPNELPIFIEMENNYRSGDYFDILRNQYRLAIVMDGFVEIYIKKEFYDLGKIAADKFCKKMTERIHKNNLDCV